MRYYTLCAVLFGESVGVGVKGRSNAYYALIEALRQPGCPICQQVDQAVRQRIDAFLYEQIIVVARRDEIREARGFCSVHGSMISGTGRMQGTAILQHDVLNDVLREINKSAAVPVPTGAGKGRSLVRLKNLVATGLRLRPFGTIANAIKPRRECPLCEYERDTEANMLRALANNLDDELLRESFAKSNGLCLSHFRVAMSGLSEVKPELLAVLTEIQLTLMTRLRDELADYIHKSNGSYDYTSMGEESDAPLRAVRMVSGRVLNRDGRL